MAFSKAPLFDPLLYHQSLWSKALAHPARIIILSHLLKNGVTPFKELQRLIPLAQETVSQHLRILRQCGLIEAEEKYPTTFYTLRHEACKTLAEKLRDLNMSFI